jgi:hypothetical protein
MAMDPQALMAARMGMPVEESEDQMMDPAMAVEMMKQQQQPGVAMAPPEQPDPAQQVVSQILESMSRILGRQDLNVEVQAKSVHTLAQAYEKMTTVQTQPQEISAEDQLQLEIAKLQMEQQIQQQKFELEREKMQMEMQLKQEQAAMDAQIKQQQAEQQLRQQEESHQLNSQMSADKHEHGKQMDAAKLSLAARQADNKSNIQKKSGDK